MDPALEELYAEGGLDDEVAVILRLADPAAVPAGVRVIAQFGVIVTCRLPRGDIPRVREAGAVRSMKRARLYGPTLDAMGGELDEAVLDARPSDRRRPDGGLPTGRGVVVAHIDWGVDFAHPDFRNDDGTTRLLALWDQSSAVDPRRPNRYGYGRIHLAGDIDGALAANDPYAALGYDPANSDSGAGSHGCHTLGISAGNGRSGGPLGLAPQADLVFVHLSTATAEGPTLLGDSVALLEAFDFIACIAGTRPFVVNCSLGRHAGQHDGKTLTEQGIDAFLLAAPGRAICWSCGNYFDRSIHACGQLRPGERRTLRLVTDVADRTPNEVDLWYPGVDRFGLKLRGPRGVAPVAVAPGERATVMHGGREIGRVYHRIGDPNNGDNQVSLFLYQSAPPGEWEITLDGDDVADGRYHAWVERDAACRNCQASFAPQDSDPRSTTGTICNGLWTLAVGAYDAHQDDRPLTAFSSCGPTRDGRERPHLVAPGKLVLSARSRPRLAAMDPPLLTRMSGTSMAAPHVTGTIALMFEAAGRPLGIEETRRLLLTATDDPPPADSLDRLRWGGGYLNTAAAVAAARESGRQRAVHAEAAMEHEHGREQTMSMPDELTARAAPAAAAETGAAAPASSTEANGCPGVGEAHDADAEAKRSPRRFVRTPPLQVQIPLIGGPPALSLPVGGSASPFAFTVPLGPTPAAAPIPVQAPAVAAPAQPGVGMSGVAPVPKSGAGVLATPAPGLTAEPVPSEPAPLDPIVSEPATLEPVPVPAAQDPAAPLALPAAPLYADPGSPRAVDGTLDEASTRSSTPFQVQVPLTGGAPALALPLGGGNSPFAFTVPFGASSSPAARSAPSVPAGEPSEPQPWSDFGSDAVEPLEDWQEFEAEAEAGPCGEAETDEQLAQPIDTEMAEVREAEYGSEADAGFGEQVLDAAERTAAVAAGTSSSGVLDLLARGSSRGPYELGARALPAPTATMLFNLFARADDGRQPGNALHRHYARRFELVARPNQPAIGLALRVGDLLVRVARGEGWGHVAVVAAPGLVLHDRLADARLRGEDYPRLRPGLYVQVVEPGPRRRQCADRFARRVSDAQGRVLPDTLLVRAIAAPEMEAEGDAGADASAAPSGGVPTLRKGDQGAAVAEAQRKLNRVHEDSVALGLPGLPGCPLSEDGRFDARMERAVRAFQERLLADPSEWNGVIGRATWQQLELLTGRLDTTPGSLTRQAQIAPGNRSARTTTPERLAEAFAEQAPAAAPPRASACAYFFKGSDYVRYDIANDTVNVGPVAIARFWPRLPAAFMRDLDAAVNWGNGKAYLFKEANYVRYNIATDRPDFGPVPIAANWTALPAAFARDLDAVVNWGNGKAYFFKGVQYLRYDIATDTVDFGPASIAANWTALPAGFTSNLDAVVNWGNGKAYFFKGPDYVRYDIATDVVDVGPVAIARNWPALPAAFRRDLGTALNWTFPNDLAGLMRSAGLTVNEVANWRTNGRPGGFHPIGIMLHHTAGNNDLHVVVNGRPDLNGPLANFYVGRNAEIHVVSGGRANHAGGGAQRVLDEVRGGVAPPDTAAHRGLSDGPVGNGFFYGFENENLGNGQAWPAAQLDSIARACAALCQLHCWSENRVISHAEWTARKPDPRGIDMNDFRRTVRSLF
jgi:subtilisin family serine protease/peptidoglycan hydrolase-like protein with peptidoglycan-binding domain